MLRLIVTAAISILISFGAISKSQKLSNLLNHVTQDHASHSHDHHEKHHHSHKNSKNKKSSEKNHSHQFDLSLLSQFFTFESNQANTVVIHSSIGEELLPIFHTSLVLGRYSLSIFRPPIA